MSIRPRLSGWEADHRQQLEWCGESVIRVRGLDSQLLGRLIRLQGYNLRFEEGEKPRLGPSVLHGEREERTIQSPIQNLVPRSNPQPCYVEANWRVRKSIATQLYAGIGGAVALTMGASIVAWIIFGRIGDTQDQINEGSMSDMAGAFRVAQRVSALAALRPRLALAQSPPEFETVQAEVHLARTSFEASLAALAESGGESEGIRRVRVGSAQ